MSNIVGWRQLSIHEGRRQLNPMCAGGSLASCRQETMWDEAAWPYVGMRQLGPMRQEAA